MPANVINLDFISQIILCEMYISISFTAPTFWNTHNAGFSFQMRQQVSNPHKTRGKISILYIWVFILRWQKWRQTIMDRMVRHSISSCMECGLISIATKHFKLATYSKDLLVLPTTWLCMYRTMIFKSYPFVEEPCYRSHTLQMIKTTIRDNMFS